MFITKIIPRGKIKDWLRCFYYNNFKYTKKFTSNSKNNIFKIIFKNGVEIKFYNKPHYAGEDVLKGAIEDIENILNGYLANYNIKNGDVIVDAGAYLGAFTLYAAKLVGKEGRVIAYEPHPLLYENLKNNIKLNKLDNCTAIHKGLWSENAIIKFNPLTNGSATLIFDSENAEPVINVPVVKLDDEFKKLKIKKIDFIKMDIEGAEIEATNGCRDILKNNNINLAIASYHIVNGYKTNIRLEQLLSEIGYKVKTCFPQHQTTYALKIND